MRIGNPGDTTRYDVFHDNDVTVYLMKGMRIPDGKVEVTLSNYIIAKSLTAKGVRY
ncbi:hypothetical protein [Gudongella sp. DL1XJH-153]|uniref:hypothetical protein n=1 Tax=Gudongella sp. DL1XJH-153 TaxID=3409804 RepID=UPI003BB7E76D